MYIVNKIKSCRSAMMSGVWAGLVILGVASMSGCQTTGNTTTMDIRPGLQKMDSWMTENLW